MLLRKLITNTHVNMEYTKEVTNKPIETFENNQKGDIPKKKSNKISFKTAHGLVLGLNQFFSKQCKKNPNFTYTAEEMRTIFSEKVVELNLLAKKEEVELEEWDKKLPILNKKEVEMHKTEKLEDLKEGGLCPHCHQFVKRYKRKINSGMAITLINIYKFNKENKDFFHVEDYGTKNNIKISHDFSLLRFWNLIEKCNGEKDDGNKNIGFYKITPRGIDFVEKKINVKKSVFLFNDKFLGFSDEEINIKDALGSKFNYDELMEM